MKTITIGRDSSCDIVINNPRVSRMHGVFTLQNNNYVYRDNSTNGTVVNGVLVKKSEINVKIGDSIMLASDEPIQWHKVTTLLPTESETTTAATNSSKPASNNQGVPPSLNRWSWGGFFFGWLWAVTNRIYWPLIIFIPFIGWFAIIIVNILLGLNGNRWAWNSDNWESVDAFERVQYTWAKVAAIIFLTMIAGGLLCIISMLTFAGGLMSLM
ncbi:MAG: FHA domain-containing protein [Rikenellaceae bacterium]